jgi:hypothetical protein
MRHHAKKRSRADARGNNPGTHPDREVVMNEQNENTQTPAPAPQAAETQAELPTKASVVDAVFDAVTGWAVDGLYAARRGLETGARWLEGRARRVGELAQKLEHKPAA